MQVFGVGELARYIREYLQSDDVLSDVWVEGEIGTLSRAASGHCYFTIRDDRGQLSCVMFRGALASCGVTPASGMAVSLHGAISFYEAGGRLQLMVDLLYPAGLGAGALQFEALRLKLEKEGLFAPERKRALPTFPKRIGLVTSDGGAVLHDVLNVVGRRYPIAEILFAHSSVQGELAPRQLVDAIGLVGWYHQNREPVDVLIIARGGGSAEDLVAFNDERVARAIYGSPVPTVSAVGHEVDITIADWVADRRAPTPSAAAELVTPDMAELRQHLAGLSLRAARLLSQRLEQTKSQLRDSELRLSSVSPLETIRRRRLEIATALERSAISLRNRLQVTSEQLDGRKLQLQVLSPLQTLSRGYAIIQDADGAVLPSAALVQDGSLIKAILHDGFIDARVEGVSAGEMNDRRNDQLRGELSAAPGNDRGT